MINGSGVESSLRDQFRLFPPMARDSFFSKSTKRKRGVSNAGPSKKRKPFKPGESSGSKKQRKDDDELDSAGSDDDLGGNIDDLELRASDVDEKASGDELETETAAQKRIRLAKLYLQSVQEELGM